MSRRDPGRAPGYQGEVVDRLLPRDRRFRVRHRGRPRAGRCGRRRGDGHRRNAGCATGDVARRERAQARNSRAARAVRGAALRRGRHRLRGLPRRQPGARRRSARAAGLRSAKRVPAGAPERGAADGEVTRAERINRVCARCHQVLFSRYPFTWEGGQRRGGEPGGQLDHLRRGARSVAGRLRAPDVLRDLPRPARRGSARRAGTAGHARRQRGLRPLPRAVRRARGAGQHAHHDPNGAGAQLRRVPHAAQEHGARLRAHPLPPDWPPRRSGARRARPSARVRALPRRQDRRGAGDHHGALVGAQVRSRRPGAALRRASTRSRFRPRSNGAGRTSRRWRWRRWARRT